jgi:hypothetical protein
MLRPSWNAAAAGVLAAGLIAPTVQASPTRLPGADAAGLVVKTHGSHTSCEFGDYRENGRRREGWHRHRRGESLRCSPPSSSRSSEGSSRSESGSSRGSDDNYRGRGMSEGSRGGRTTGSTSSSGTAGKTSSSHTYARKKTASSHTKAPPRKPVPKKRRR